MILEGKKNLTRFNSETGKNLAEDKKKYSTGITGDTSRSELWG